MNPSTHAQLDLTTVGMAVCLGFLAVYLVQWGIRHAVESHKRQRAIVAQLNSALHMAQPSYLTFGRWAAECDIEAANPRLIPGERQKLRDQAARFREAQLDAMGDEQ